MVKKLRKLSVFCTFLVKQKKLLSKFLLHLITEDNDKIYYGQGSRKYS